MDAELEAWLRGLWTRRGLPFPEINRKQAWLIPSARALPNPNGTAPGWWVDRPDGRVVIVLPGPPREMRPMWFEQVLPDSRRRRPRQRPPQPDPAPDRDRRVTGSPMSSARRVLRRTNPEIATYARADGVDVRISAYDRPGRPAAELLDEVEADVLDRLGDYVWARGSTTWTEAIAGRARPAGLDPGDPRSRAPTGRWPRCSAGWPGFDGSSRCRQPPGPAVRASPPRPNPRHGRAAATVGLAVDARPRGDDTVVTIGIATPLGLERERRLGFLGGSQGRSRAALLAAAALLRRLRAAPAG